MAEGLELAAAKRLLDDAKAGGFAFQRTGPEPDAPLLGVRETTEWVDEIVPDFGPGTPAWLSGGGVACWWCLVGCRWHRG